MSRPATTANDAQVLADRTRSPHVTPRKSAKKTTDPDNVYNAAHCSVKPIEDLGAIDVAAIARLSKALGDPLRLEILQALKWHSLSVNELCQVFELRQPALSHHLKILLREQLLQTRKEGNSTFYRRHLPAASNFSSIAKLTFELLDQQRDNSILVEKLSEIDKARSEQAQRFFDSLAQRTRSSQEFIVDFSVYRDAAVELLASLQLAGNTRLLELGSGYGEFLALVSKRYASVTAVDISQGLIQQAKRRLADHEIEHVNFVHGELGDLSPAASFDVAVCNMVLHHVSSPPNVLRELASRLAPSGHLIITELCQHEQSWARTDCGDIWLGFEPQSLIADAQSAGLLHRRQNLLALRNGFQVQLHLFQKA